MGLKQTYAVWNNKGGVGKSTITFHLAARYAERNPATRVLVIDLCPQANASMMLLGGGTKGEGIVLQRCQGTTPKTVVGYMANVIAAGPGAPLTNPVEWLIQVSKTNDNISPNLFLMCGDGNLEPMAPLISDRAAAPPLTASNNPWAWIHLIVRSFIENLVKTEAKQDWTVFIDTNPSFSIYTEIAVSSATRLIVPVNADDSSRVAINAMFTLLHGSTPPHPIYGKYTYAAKAHEHGLHIPQVHLIVGNRLTQYDGAAKAFDAMTAATAESLFNAYKADLTRFSSSSRRVTTLDAFRDTYSLPLRDFNTAGVVAAHHGLPVSKLSDKEYEVHNSTVRVDKRRVNDCLEAVDAVLNRL